MQESSEIRRTHVLKASPRMFDSNLMDRLSRVHPIVPMLIFGPGSVALLVLALGRLGVLSMLAWAFAGYFFWTLSEYWIHRAIFHFEPEDGIGARLHWIIHGVHHDHPNDPLRLVMPPSVSVPMGALFLGAFVLIMGSPTALAFAGGFFGGYLAYDMTHYHLHHHAPRTRLGKLMRELHMRHHFQDETTGYGISAPYWDHAFGTSTRQRTARR
jgi:dihydroceramide fatty acyl 2-hydroxylase